ncbi:TPA: lytic transglycosylase [Escherichia coli]|nr:lytic transglycosylase [Escherichia coli]HAH9729363.1 lytic transglycosylase [Escherichia coli]HAP0124971.1 lytic transglycosylase [Escherichia coli]HAP0234946.1 lytic transglycosylase [Escherichia coli]HAP0245545.1 lytic transglycosylase [Escherichia coli]
MAWGAKVSREFKLKVIEVCERLEINPDYLMSCMAFETGETFSPSVRNPNGSATGLIQFMSNTARALGTTINELASMTSVEQMDYVEKYFKPYTGKIKTIEDVYMVIFCPRAVGKPNSYILYNEGRSYDDNKGLDLNKDNAITKYEAGFKVREKLKLGMKDGYRG